MKAEGVLKSIASEDRFDRNETSACVLVHMHEVFQKLTGWCPLFVQAEDGRPFVDGICRFGIRPYPHNAQHPLAGKNFYGRDVWDAIGKAFNAIDHYVGLGHRARTRSFGRIVPSNVETTNA